MIYQKMLILGLFVASSMMYGESTLYTVKTRKNQEKYLHGGTEELVTFYVPKDESSQEMIARKGLLIRRPGAQATVLICHGFGCNMKNVRFVRTMFGDKSDNLILNTMIFDFRAHGEDAQNQTCSFGKNEALDVRAAARLLREHPDLKNKPLIVYGFSMGAVASMLAQAHDPTLFDYAIWDCPFDTFSNVINRAVQQLTITCCGHTIKVPGGQFFQRYAYNPYVQKILKLTLKFVAQMDATHIDTTVVPVDTTEAAKKITIPAFFIVCRNDEKAPIEAVRANFNNTQGIKKLWITNGDRHCDSMVVNPEKYTELLRDFIQKACQDGSFSTHTEIIEDDEDEFVVLEEDAHA